MDIYNVEMVMKLQLDTSNGYKAFDYRIYQDLKEKGWSFCGIAMGKYHVYQLRYDVVEWVNQQDPTKWTHYEVDYGPDVYHFTDELIMLLILRWS